MASLQAKKPHAVCIPYPAQGHITPMLKFAKLLHSKGFHITFVNTEFNHKRLLRSRGPSSLQGTADFHFEAIPDGLPPSDEDATQHIPTLCDSISKNCLQPFRKLVARLNNASSCMPPVISIIPDLSMSFALQVSEELNIPAALFWCAGACSLMAYFHYQELIARGLIPLKDESDLVNGYLDTPVEWMPGMSNMRLRDFPTFIRTTDANDIVLKYVCHEMERVSLASCIVINTFHEFESQVLDAMSSMLPPVYTVGPLSLLSHQMPKSPLASIGSNLWKEDQRCLEWLEGKAQGSVVYVNFGSTTVMTNNQLIEFAWGLANSGYDFLWVIRPDLVRGDAAALPQEFLAETEGRSLLLGWCPQEQVLLHPSVGGFLTHGGWNSTIESVGGGVPMIFWPFFADQQTNCHYACTEWGIGMEIDNNLEREKLEGLVRELMGEGKGVELRKRALGWRESAARATETSGSSYQNLERVVENVLLKNKST